MARPPAIWPSCCSGCFLRSDPAARSPIAADVWPQIALAGRRFLGAVCYFSRHTGDMKSPWNTAATALNASVRSLGLCTSWCCGRSRSPNRSIPSFARIASSSSRTAQPPLDLLVFVALLTFLAGRALSPVCGGHDVSVRAGAIPPQRARGDTAHGVRLAGVRARASDAGSVPHFALAAAVGISVPGSTRGCRRPERSSPTWARACWYSRRFSCCIRRCGRSCGRPMVPRRRRRRFPPGGPPIVMVVFDQLPLTSLLSESGGIDPRYPNFAALADDATWFRNATTVAELTGWAMPALTSGSSPQRLSAAHGA